MLNAKCERSFKIFGTTKYAKNAKGLMQRREDAEVQNSNPDSEPGPDANIQAPEKFQSPTSKVNPDCFRGRPRPWQNWSELTLAATARSKTKNSRILSMRESLSFDQNQSTHVDFDLFPIAVVRARFTIRNHQEVAPFQPSPHLHGKAFRGPH